MKFPVSFVPLFILSSLLLALSPLAVSAESMAGKTMLAVGKVEANNDNKIRKLKRRAPVYSQEIVTTGGKARAQIRMSDGGLIALKANSTLAIADYQYSEETGQGSVVMELVKGGLRSVTGNIKAKSGDYQLKTPVGSIGIRGTHYEVEVVGEEMFVAVWDGAIDVKVEVGEFAGTQISFGEGEDYSYATIDTRGKVTRMVVPPKVFEAGLSGDYEVTADDNESNDAESDEQTTEGDASSEEVAEEEQAESEETEGSTQNNTDNTQVASNTEGNSEADLSTGLDTAEGLDDSLETLSQTDVIANDLSEDKSFAANDDFNTVEPDTTADLIANRSGQFTYDTVDSFEVTSTQGAISQFQVSMDIDFDTLGVTAGNLTFDDPDGEWRATFSGHFSGEGQFALDISHASHGNALAQGEIDAAFFDGLDSLLGSFHLEETLQPNINVNGTFVVK